MKAVLISIQPKWCELIVSGKKTVEVRKTKPKLETPFKCYIYETKRSESTYWSHRQRGRLGKIIGEFICRNIDFHSISELIVKEDAERALLDTYLTRNEVLKYIGYPSGTNIYAKPYNFYGWHISDLVIYDKPKALSEFYVEGDCDCMNCKSCAWFDRGNGHNVEDDCNLAYKGVSEHKSFKPILRPPQSWCYVEGADR
jgi:predicted transcriptional regulator